MASSGLSQRMIFRSKSVGSPVVGDEFRRAAPPIKGGATLGCVLLLFAEFFLCAPTSADQIVTNNENYRAAKIVGFEGGEVRLRTSDGRLRSEWIDRIRLLLVERGGVFEDFNQAERFFSDGQPARAIVRYRRSLRVVQDFWPDLIAARLLRACEEANQLDTAVLNWIRLLEGDWGGPSAAARLLPKNIGGKRNQRAIKAIEQLDSARARSRHDAQVALIELLRFEILRQVHDDRTASAAHRAASVTLPTESRSPEVYRILLSAMTTSLSAQEQSNIMVALDRAIAHCPDSLLPDFLLLKGQTLKRSANTPQELMRAAWPLLRVPIHFAGDPRAAVGLYEAAGVLDRLGRRKKASELLSECLKHAHVTEATKKLALSAQLRLESNTTPNRN